MAGIRRSTTALVGAVVVCLGSAAWGSPTSATAPGDGTPSACARGSSTGLSAHLVYGRYVVTLDTDCEPGTTAR